MNQRIPILVYHHVYPDGADELNVNKPGECTGVIAESAFGRQMQYLADNKMTIVSTSSVVDWLIDDAPLPERAVVLHFDNGWLDTITVAKPVLDTFGFTATCFVITDSANATSQGKRAAIHTKTEGTVEKPFMAWDQIRGLVAAGWEIGAHTATHCRMADKHGTEGDEGVLGEVDRSGAAFEEQLGCVPLHFAYPSGSRNTRTDELLQDHYRSLRLWHFEQPPAWSFTTNATSPLAIDCQNIDNTVTFADFERLFEQAFTDG
jgi:peptidoglycan/xylan/chitin deacetylase (PgdA/CDA1 family)